MTPLTEAAVTLNNSKVSAGEMNFKGETGEEVIQCPCKGFVEVTD